MPLHTRFRPACEEAFVPTMIQQGKTLPVKYSGRRGKSSLSIHLLCNGEKTQKLWKPLLTQFSLSEASRNGLHNGIERDDFPTTTSQPTRTKISSNSS